MANAMAIDWMAVNKCQTNIIRDQKTSQKLKSSQILKNFENLSRDDPFNIFKIQFSHLNEVFNDKN